MIDHPPDPTPSVHGTTPTGRALALLTLGPLGVVFGDLGTSPLYALQECFWWRVPGCGDAGQRARRRLVENAELARASDPAPIRRGTVLAANAAVVTFAQRQPRASAPLRIRFGDAYPIIPQGTSPRYNGTTGSTAESRSSVSSPGKAAAFRRTISARKPMSVSNR